MIEILTPAQVDRARRTGALVADILQTLRSRSEVGTNLLDLDREGLERFFADTLGEKRFRAQQVMKWIYHRHVTDFAEMTDLGKALREKLEQHAEVVPHGPVLGRLAVHHAKPV